MQLRYLAYPAKVVANLRKGGPDVYGNPAEHVISDGPGNPCRSCLDAVPRDTDMLICAARPFSQLHAYAETGPIFFCGDACEPYRAATLPPILTMSPDFLLKAYDRDERIIYGTGQITRSQDIAAYAAHLLSRDDVAFVDVRSARNNCFMTRIVPDT